MTDEATGGASAPAEQISAPAVEESVSTPNPISTESQSEPAADAKAKPFSIDDALDRAAAKVEKASRDSAPKDDTKAVKSDAVRDETGKFAAKDAPKTDGQPVKDATVAKDTTQAITTEPAKTTPATDAPARFSPDAKTAWTAAPDSVRAEVHRMERELTAGMEKYRASAEEFEKVREFDDLAKQTGGNLRASLERVVAIEQAFKRNPLEGFQKVADHFGLSLRAVAAHIAGQTPDQQAVQADSTIAALRQELVGLKQQISGVTQTITQQKEAATLSEIQKFAQDKPRFDELADDIGMFLSNGRAKDLQEAYVLADRLNPGHANPPQANAIATTQVASAALAFDQQAQTLKGQKSINGAPSPGSNPAARKRSTSIDDAIDRAFASAG